MLRRNGLPPFFRRIPDFRPLPMNGEIPLTSKRSFTIIAVNGRFLFVRREF
jgi:hypothetical protein